MTTTLSPTRLVASNYPTRPAANGDAQATRRYRERDFGIGYGTSSGYALEKRYTSDWGQARFRCR